MPRVSRAPVGVAALVLWALLPGSVAAQRPDTVAQTPASTSADAGALAGTVATPDGVPAAQVIVSAVGPKGAVIAVTDDAGHFRFDALPRGQYLVRAHRADGTAGRRIVRVDPARPAVARLTLGREPAEGELDLQLAGGLPFGVLPVVLATEAEQPSEADAPTDPDEARTGDDPAVAVLPHDPGARAWWLRRARRSVLKDRGAGAGFLPADPAGAAPAGGTGAGEWATADRTRVGESLLASLTGGLPLAGQVQFLTRASFAAPSPQPALGSMPGQVAYVAVTPTGDGDADWAVRGTVDMTTSDAASWAVAGWYAVAPHDDHNVQVSMSYSRQAAAGGADESRFNARSLAAAANIVERAAGRLADRQVGRIAAIDTWEVSPLMLVDYGAELARYGYLQDGRLFSPRAAVTLSPLAGSRVRVALSQRMTAPGAEQFLPPLDGFWLPPERTFTSLSGFDDLQAERTRQVEVGVEHDLGDRAVVGVRRFRQDVDSQLVTLFAPGLHVPSGTLPAPGGHYYLASAHGVATDGWGVSYRHRLPGLVTGEVDYRIVRAVWSPADPVGAAALTLTGGGGTGLLRTGAERVHDVTTTLEAEVPRTATRIVARCRVSSGFTRADADAVTAGVDARFDVRVTQTLPFSPIEGSQWELLVAFRSLFHEQADGASIYDELLVVDPPRQFVGGLVVHF